MKEGARRDGTDARSKSERGREGKSKKREKMKESENEGLVILENSECFAVYETSFVPQIFVSECYCDGKYSGMMDRT